MTVFDSLRFPVSRDELVNGDLLDRLPVYLRNKWWWEIQKRGEKNSQPYIYNNETPSYMRWWLGAINDKRLEPMMYQLREMIAKYGE